MRPRLAWVLFCLCLVLLALVVFLAILGGSQDEIASSGPLLVLTGVVFPLVGAFIASRRPEHPIGWIYLGSGLLIIVAFCSIAYGDYALLSHPGDLPGAAPAVWLGTWLWAPGMILLATFSFLLFPDGHLPSRRWRPVAWISGAALVLAVASGLLLAGEPARELLEGETSGIAGSALMAALLLAAVAMISSVVSLFIRLRRATGVKRQQLKWFLAAGAMFALGIPFAFEPLLNVPGAGVVSSVVVYAIPLATGVAILRYRLYDIDRVINRTLVYGALTAILAAAYFGLVVVLQQVLPLGEDQGLAVAGSTLGVAALFRPLRAHIQGFIDRRFYRSKYDAAQMLERFSARLRDEVDLDALTRELLGVVQHTMHPAHASLWLRRPAGRDDGRQRSLAGRAASVGSSHS